MIGTQLQTEFFVELAQGCIDRRLSVIESSTRECPLARMSVHAGRSSAQQKGGPASHAKYPSVETVDVSRNTLHRIVAHRARILVIVRIAVDENDGYGSVAVAVERVRTPCVRRKVVGYRVPESVVVENHEVREAVRSSPSQTSTNRVVRGLIPNRRMSGGRMSAITPRSANRLKRSRASGTWIAI